MFFGYPGAMEQYLHSSLLLVKELLNTSNDVCITKNKLLPMTITPYIFITKKVIELISLIEKKYKITFELFFENNKYNITEFYIYFAYLFYTNSLTEYFTLDLCNKFTCIFQPPLIDWNSLNTHEQILKENSCKMFGLHRLALQSLSENDKEKLINIYTFLFDKDDLTFIKYMLNN